ncbi:LysR family transcriptional regulator [Streptomyces abyssomicinicus]|uniref:LysR family transcriptional regulator n=1 Tax=Streptomyces abyssomicinicus TaxID=574929 RepID=UPI00124F7CF7|nr:LysR family transcriptional regulator [Streptomyces abyssomicinicus]
MDRRHLTHFLAVVEHGGISGAARKLRVSQPAVSQTIKDLERDLGTRLFHREPRLTLTPAGRALVGPARRILRSFESARAAVHEVDDLATGRLDIAVVPGLGLDPVVPLVTRFRTRHPGVLVALHEAAYGPDGFEALRRADAELLVSDHPAPYAKHEAVPLGLQELFAVFPPHTEGLPDRPLRVADVVRHPWVAQLPHRSQLGVWFASVVAAERLPPPTVVVETAHRDTIVPLVLAGAGMALLPAPVAAAAKRHGAQVRPLAFNLPNPCHLFHRRGPLTSAALAFVALAQDAVPPGAGRPSAATNGSRSSGGPGGAGGAG